MYHATHACFTLNTSNFSPSNSPKKTRDFCDVVDVDGLWKIKAAFVDLSNGLSMIRLIERQASLVSEWQKPLQYDTSRNLRKKKRCVTSGMLHMEVASTRPEYRVTARP